MTHSDFTQISLVIPVYNEYESLPVLHEKLQAMQQEYSEISEIVYIDDGSTDGSLSILEGFAKADKNVIVAAQRRNFGKSAALMVGFALASKDYIVMMDADLQDEPQEIPRLRDKLEEGYDIVIGWKANRQDPITKTIPSKIANTVTRLSVGLDIHDMNSGFKIFRKDCAKNMNIYGDLHRFVPALAHLDGYSVAEVPVLHHQRMYGKSKYGAGRLLRGGLDYMTVIFLGRFYRQPMYFFGTMGIISFVLGMLINLKLAIDWFGGESLSTRPLLLLGVLLTVMGVQFFTIGFVAEMLVRMRQNQQNPLGSLRETINIDLD